MNFLILLMVNFLFGTTVVVQSESTNNVAYEKHLNTHTNKISFIDYQIKNSGQSQVDQKLKKAQFEFLKGSLKSSARLFNNIVDLRHSFEWNRKERKKIQYAIMRAAQLETNLGVKRELVRKAAIFDIDLDPEKSLFPPPLISLFQKIKAKQVNKNWMLPEKAKAYEVILLNGKKVQNKAGFLEAPAGLYSIVFLSNKYHPFEVTTSLTDLEKIKLPLAPLAKGGCGQWQLSNNIKNNKSFELYDKGCLSNESQLPLREQLAFAKTPYKENKKTPRFLKNKWFWIGVSVVAAGLTWHSLSQKGGSSSGGGPQASPPDSQPVVYSN